MNGSSRFVIGLLVCVFVIKSWLVVSEIDGGSAANGKIENGKYYVGNHGRYTEVSPSRYRLNQWLDRSNTIILVVYFGGCFLYGYWRRGTLPAPRPGE